MTREVKQRRGNDCAIAAVANACGLSYAEVRRKCGPPRDGLTTSDLDWLLCEFGEWHYITPRRKPPISEWSTVNRRGAYVVNLWGSSILPEELHSVAVIDGAIYGNHSPDWLVVAYWRQK